MDNQEFANSEKKQETQETKTVAETKPTAETKTDSLINSVNKALDSMQEKSKALHAKLTDDVTNTVNQLLKSYETTVENLSVKPKTKEQELLDEYRDTFYEHTYFRKK